VTIGSVHDVKMFIPLLKDSLSILRKVKTVEYLIGDAAYDSIRTMREAICEGLMPVVKLNRRKGKPKRIRAKVRNFLQTEEGQRVFGLRGAIERANSFLKEGMKIDKFPSHVRGLRRAALFVREKMLAALAAMLTNLKTQKPTLSYA
jgi:IS5 family transposase